MVYLSLSLRASRSSTFSPFIIGDSISKSYFILFGDRSQPSMRRASIWRLGRPPACRAKPCTRGRALTKSVPQVHHEVAHDVCCFVNRCTSEEAVPDAVRDVPQDCWCPHVCGPTGTLRRLGQGCCWCKCTQHLVEVCVSPRCISGQAHQLSPSFRGHAW